MVGVEVECEALPIADLQQVVIQRFLLYSHFLCGFVQRHLNESLVLIVEPCVQPPPNRHLPSARLYLLDHLGQISLLSLLVLLQVALAYQGLLPEDLVEQT